MRNSGGSSSRHFGWLGFSFATLLILACVAGGVAIVSLPGHGKQAQAPPQQSAEIGASVDEVAGAFAKPTIRPITASMEAEVKSVASEEEPSGPSVNAVAHESPANSIPATSIEPAGGEPAGGEPVRGAPSIESPLAPSLGGQVDVGRLPSSEDEFKVPQLLADWDPSQLPTGRIQGPHAKDRQITLVVATLLRREHLLNDALDDNHSRRGLTNFLNSLDPMKIYLNRLDIEEFMQHRDELDDDVKRGDIRFAYLIFNRFLDRVDGRLTLVHELLSVPHDFALDEEMITDRDELHHPDGDVQVHDRWRRRIKYDLLQLKSEEVVGGEARERLWRRYLSFARRTHQTDSDELLELYLTAMTTGFDPHTTYMSPSSLENFHIMMRLNLEGIGAALQVVDGYTVVSKVIPGGAADKHGKLKPEDRIVSVGQGEVGEMSDVVDMKLSDVVKMIRGRAGTIVRLGVNSGGNGDSKVYKITRAKIELKDSEARGVVFEKGMNPDGSPFLVGVIDLPSFYMDMSGARERTSDFKSTTRDVRRLLDDFNSRDVDAVILDLRRNGGGSLTEAINLTGLFVDGGPVVQVRDSIGHVQQYNDSDPGMSWDGPLVVLTSKFSASASEIFAGAIQDYKRGLVIGDIATHGKGTVQSLVDLGSQLFRIPNPPNLGALKITMQQFYRPNGDSTQQQGVLSDITLPSISTHMDVAESDLDFALEFQSIPEASYGRYKMVSQPMLDQLRNRSTERITETEEFVELAEKIERYLEQKERKRISLNEKKFFDRLAQFDTDKEEEDQLDDEFATDDLEIERTYYIEEVLSITIDYLNLLGDRRVASID